MKKELDMMAVLEMKRPEYKKMFKKKALWKRAAGIIVLVDYKLDGKKTSLAIPYKKKPLMLQELKKIKGEKLHLLKKTGLCSFELNKKEGGGLLAKIELIKGGISAALLHSKMLPLFGAVDIDIEVVGLEAVLTEGIEDNQEASEQRLSESAQQKALLKSTNRSFLYIRDLVLPNFKKGRLDSEDLLEIDRHEAIFKQFKDSISEQEENPTALKLQQAIQKLAPQLTKIRTALDGSNPQLAHELMQKKLQDLAKTVEKKTKKIKKTVVKNLRKQQTNLRDIDVLEEVLELINEFEFNLEVAEAYIQDKLRKMADKILLKLKPQLGELLNKVVATSPQKISETADNERLKLRYAAIDDRVQEMKLRIEDLLEQVAAEENNKPQEAALPEGDDFLNNLS